MGNSKGRAVYEANLPDDFRRPQTDSAVESFVRQKYEKKKFLASEWVPTKPPDVPVGWEEAGGQTDTKKVEFKKLQLPARGGSGASRTSPVNTSPRVEARTVASTAPAPLTVSLPPTTAAATTSASTIVTDLLGLSLGSTSSTPAQPAPPPSSSSQDLLGLNSEFSAFVSASPAGPTQPSEVTQNSQVGEIITILKANFLTPRLTRRHPLTDVFPKTLSWLYLDQSLALARPSRSSPLCLDSSRAQVCLTWASSSHLDQVTQ